MRMNELKGLAEKLTVFAQKSGASQTEVSIYNSNNFSVDILNQEIEQLQEAGSINLSLKVIVDGKVATASSSDLSMDALQHLTKNAISRASYSNPDKYSALPDNEKIKTDIDKLKLYDPSVEELSPEKKIQAVMELEKICIDNKMIKMSAGASFNTGTAERILANSNGFSGAYKSSYCSNGVYLQAGSDEVFFEDGWSDSSRTANGLMPVEEIAKKAIHRVTRLIGAKKIDTQNVPVVFEAPMAASILGFLAQCLSGTAVYQKRTFLSDMLGEKIANDNVNIMDDALMPGKPGTRPFDGEGVPTGKTSIIENGTLKNFLLDTYSARKLDMKSNGHASGTTNFYMAPGKHSLEDIIKSTKKGLFLTRTIGQGTVPTSGDISKGAYGLWIENGELTYPVAEITLSGNLGTMLKEIEMVGSELDFRRSINSPAFKVKEMTISGK